MSALAIVPKPNAATITLGDPYPLLDEGTYRAICTEATFDWANRFKKFKARLTMEPQNYTGRPYHGQPCAFFDLGSNPNQPYAGPTSLFHRLYTAVNGDQPTSSEVTMDIFIGHLYEIDVQTVKANRHHIALLPQEWYSVIRKVRFVE